MKFGESKVASGEGQDTILGLGQRLISAHWADVIELIIMTERVRHVKLVAA